MSKTIVAGILINVIMVIIIICIIIFGVVVGLNDLKQCETEQSPFCYTIQCPADLSSSTPCGGYAKRPSGDGNWYCSNAPFVKVDDDGNVK